MKILLINKFLTAKGGDAISTLTTGQILITNGHEVFFWGMAHPDNPTYLYQDYFVSNVDYDSSRGPISGIRAAMKILYSFEAKKKIAVLIENIKPDIVHLNNFAHQISPSILDEIKKHHIPTVMTMHDYKLVCPAYSMLVNGKPCEKCKNGRYYYCVIKCCTKGSLVKSLINVFEMYLHHNLLHIYDNIDVFISPSLFLKNKVEEMGLKGDHVYLPNCVDTSDFEPSFEWQDQSIVYVGRLSHEKGVKTLVNAVKRLDNIQLKIIGDGPMKTDLANQVASENINNVIFCGYKNGQDLYDEIRKTMFIVIPSECYENNPRTVIEAFALGKPAVGAKIGGIPELVRDGETGYTFASGDVDDLSEKIKLMLDNTNKIPEMGKKARKYVEHELNSYVYYERLIKVYEKAAKKAYNQYL